MTTDPLATLAQLVAIPSVNPMGRSVSGPQYGEGPLTDHLERVLRGLGLLVQRQAVEPGRDNLIARLDGDPPPELGGNLILLAAHQDTVPVEGMTIDPWAPVVREGRLYGRGACDVKGGMAAMLAAVARLRELPPTERPTVLMACTVNEEHGFSGAIALSRLWNSPSGSSLAPKPDWAVVAEPTGMKVVVAHMGVVRWCCHTRGRAAHSSRPDLGDNAIYKMARAVEAIERYQREVAGSLASHRLCGPARLSVGTIRGGVGVNTVPDRCTIEIDCRFPPGQQPELARRHLVDYLAGDARLGFPLEQDPPYMQGLALSDDANGPLADRLSGVVREVVGDCRQVGEPYATDAAFFASAGVPSVVFGPGSVEQAHTHDEWISLEQLQQAAEVYYRFGRSLSRSARTRLG